MSNPANTESQRRVAVVGGGAAGFFAALACAEANPLTEVTIYEKSARVLAKVQVSGGGRCNVTHDCHKPALLAKHYPRGERFLKPLFQRFSPADTVRWFESRGVRLKTEADGRMFPVTDRSETIIDCFLREAERLRVKIITGCGVEKLIRNEKGFLLQFSDGQTKQFYKVLIASGGSPSGKGYDWLAELGHAITPPVPSLFTFNIPDSPFEGLQGVSVNDALVKIQGTDLAQRGALMITHWGLSAPAVLKTSAFGARILNERDYRFTCILNFAPDWKDEAVRAHFEQLKRAHPVKLIENSPCFDLPRRLWERLVQLSEIKEGLRWGEVPKKQTNKLADWVLYAKAEAAGKTTFKEEFVTAGGVSLTQIDPQTMESQTTPNLFFAGEVLDIDGITGGFNFQSAWTTGWIAGRAMAV